MAGLGTTELIIILAMVGAFGVGLLALLVVLLRK